MSSLYEEIMKIKNYKYFMSRDESVKNKVTILNFKKIFRHPQEQTHYFI